jgi:uncharacterized protein (DUF58 family)
MKKTLEIITYFFIGFFGKFINKTDNSHLAIIILLITTNWFFLFGNFYIILVFFYAYMIINFFSKYKLHLRFYFITESYISLKVGVFMLLSVTLLVTNSFINTEDPTLLEAEAVKSTFQPEKAVFRRYLWSESEAVKIPFQPENSVFRRYFYKSDFLLHDTCRDR